MTYFTRPRFSVFLVASILSINGMAIAQSPPSEDFIQPGHSKYLELVPVKKRVPIDSGQCGMALLRAVSNHNELHKRYASAPTLLDRTVGKTSYLKAFDCYADPKGRDVFYLEMSLLPYDKSESFSMMKDNSFIIYFTFSNNGELLSWENGTIGHPSKLSD